MKQTLAGLFVIAWCLLLTAGPARSEILAVEPGVSVTLPDDWERADSGFASANAEVARIFDCATGDPGQIKTLG